jgi:hypothetical protein
MKKYMNPKRKASLPSVERSVSYVDPPPFESYFDEVKGRSREADEFTIHDFMRSTGFKDRQASRKLLGDVKAGILTGRKGKENGHLITFYKVIK